MIRHCRPCNFNQLLRRQLYVGNHVGGSDDSVEYRDPLMAPSEPGSALSGGLTAGQPTMSGTGLGRRERAERASRAAGTAGDAVIVAAVEILERLPIRDRFGQPLHPELQDRL